MNELRYVNKKELSTQELRRKETLENGMLMADKFINKNYLINLSFHSVIPIAEIEKDLKKLRLFRIEKLVYDEKENVNDKLISVYSALQNVQSTVLMILDGEKNKTTMYLGVRVNGSESAATAGKILEKGFLGNFCGSSLTALNNREIQMVMEDMTEVSIIGGNKNVSCVTVVPSARDEDKDKFVQGLEKFIDTMQGEEYTALFIATPVSKDDLEVRKRGFEELFSALSPFIKTTLSYAENESESISIGKSKSFADTVNHSISNTTGKNRGTNETRTNTTGNSNGFSFEGMSWGTNSSSSTSTGYSTGESWSKAITEGTAYTKADAETKNKTDTIGNSKTMTIEHQNKSVQVLTERIDNHLKRITECESFGVWECAGYFIADDVQTSVVAANSYKALVSGEKTGVENSFVNVWEVQNYSETSKVLEYMKYGIHPLIEVPGQGEFQGQIVTAGNLISGKELPLFTGIPHKSVSGLTVSHIAEFGRNVFVEGDNRTDRKIHIGKIYHMGIIENNDIELDLNSLTSHCFVTGSTGSGKSNTTYCLLERMIENDIPFLVIEPAKGEYKTAFGKLDDINIFTTNPKYNRMLQINPFRFDENIHVLEHLDRLIEIFNACWEMYAAMPAILKDAMEQMYIVKGWDLLNSIYLGEGKVQYPTFKDLLAVLPKIINSSSYSSDTKGDYIGALVTRVASLTNGIMGQVFCGGYDVKDEEIFDKNCIIDLSRVGSTETKSLLMGILIMKLSEYRSANVSGQNLGLSHLTVLEEAHNLLKKSSTNSGEGGANLIGKSVEMISNSIAEMRTYGEGFVIVDQSPTAVDISAIKNTNTKIIMRLPEREDCKIVGNAVSLNENQILELSKLGTGIAVIMQNNWLEAVRGKIDRASDKYEQQSVSISFDELKQLRGKIIMELLNQFIARKMDEAKVIRIIENMKISKEKKIEYIQSVKGIVTAMMKKRDSKVFSDYLMSMAHCRNLFDILEEILRGIDFKKLTEDDEMQIFFWQSEFLSKLDSYISLNAGKKKLLLKYLIYSRLKEDGTVKYIKIYHVLYR